MMLCSLMKMLKIIKEKDLNDVDLCLLHKIQQLCVWMKKRIEVKTSRSPKDSSERTMPLCIFVWHHLLFVT